MISRERSQLFRLDKLASITIPGKTITTLLTEYHNVTDEMGLSTVDYLYCRFEGYGVSNQTILRIWLTWLSFRK